MSAAPTPGFDVPPYTAHPSGGDNDWWYVGNKTGFNCLSFLDQPGAKFSTRATCEAIAREWNDAAKV